MSSDAPAASGRDVFPFDAVVGHDDAKLALRLAAIDPLIGGVLLRGHKGSAKTTLARGLAGLLGGAPFVELPLGATDDRLIGTLDTRAALTGGEIRFQPGLLATADGGVLYVDEVNLLPDHLVDVLLDVAVSGENRVERDGISHRHPARFVLVGSMNPEEGELRPQLLDRFGLCVTITAPTSLADRGEAVRRRLAFDSGRTDLPSSELGQDLRDIRPSTIDDDVITAANRLAIEVGAEGLRADLALCRAAAALAGWEGRARTTPDDVWRVAPLVLAHRSRRGPFDPPVLPPEMLDDAIRRSQAQSQSGPDAAAEPEPADDTDELRTGDAAAPDRPLMIGHARRVPEPRRARAVPSARGRVTHDRPAGPHDPIAIVPTVRELAAGGGLGPDRAIGGDLLRAAVRQAAPRRTVVLCVDLSGSMGARERAEAAAGTVLGLLTRAYERRNRVALVTFRGDRADVVLSPTASVEVARHRLDHLVTGGETPLAEGLTTALDVARRAQTPDSDVVIAILTDGRATGSPDAFERALEAGAAIRAAGVHTVVLDCETGPAPLGLAAQLADVAGAQLIHVGSLTPEEITNALLR